MKNITLGEKTYSVDPQGFLVGHEQWDKDFAEKTAPEAGIKGGLTKKHWKVIDFIRNSFNEKGVCPLVYETCRANGLSLTDLKGLFPAGYLRGACKLAGLTYMEGYVKYSWPEVSSKKVETPGEAKVYQVDVRGFLLDPTQWDENFALHKAHEMKVPGGLSEKHWQILYFIRDYFYEKGAVPTVYECCEANQLEIKDCERFFPDGYHRGAVKIAGLRVR